MKRIAIIGSSGGNLYTQGGNNPAALLGEILTQMKSAGIEVDWIEFIGAASSMDNISQDAKASLYTLGEDGSISKGEQSTLSEVNEQAKQEDEKLAQKIRDDEIDGVVMMSCDPNGVNSESVKAMAEKKIPVVGTGGTSMAHAQKAGANVISASGTTGTTNRTRAISFAVVLAKEWGLKYRPVIGSSSSGGAIEGSIWKRINLRGIMLASLPGFIAMALLLALSRIPAFEPLGAGFGLLIGALPVMIAAIAAKQVSGLDEVGIIAGIVAGILARDGGILGGLAAGILAGIFSYYAITFCFKWKVPGTTANIAAGGLAGLVAGLIGMFLLVPVALWAGNGIRWLIDVALSFNATLAGAVAGLLIWPAIMAGVYHAAILPIVLLEMEVAGFSFLGAVDMTGLVMVSAGITLANVIFPRDRGDIAVALPGFLINMGFGTFVEAAYPFMFSNKLVFAGALIAASVSGALVGMLGVMGTAYVPSILAPGLANEGKVLSFALCMLVALVVAFIITAIANKFTKAKPEKESNS